MSDIRPTFSGEFQLAGWSESHNGGCKVTFWLADSSELDAFRAMTVRKGNQSGQRLAAVLVEIGDDEQPVTQPEPEKPKGGPLAKLASMLCADPEFWKFLSVPNAENAAQTIRNICFIESRAELDTKPDAGRRFHADIRVPWLKYRAAKGLS